MTASSQEGDREHLRAYNCQHCRMEMLGEGGGAEG